MNSDASAIKLLEEADRTLEKEDPKADFELTRYEKHHAIHNKFLLINAAHGEDKKHKKIVLSGSHNYTGTSQGSNDESILEIVEENVFKAYADFWRLIHCAATGKNQCQ